ncbi:hypothetical protein ASG81_06730 [Paenibacillus sp. Soil522]|nr:hypothetical protein ASG81_06730 [Paenibacillus sp. Soil522]
MLFISSIPSMLLQKNRMRTLAFIVQITSVNSCHREATARFAVKYKLIYKCETYKFLYFNKTPDGCLLIVSIQRPSVTFVKPFHVP